MCRPMTASLLPAHYKVRSSSLAHALYHARLPQDSLETMEPSGHGLQTLKLQAKENLSSFKFCFCIERVVLSLGILSQGGKMTSTKCTSVHTLGVSYSHCVNERQYCVIICYDEALPTLS